MLIYANYGYPQATAGEETGQTHLLILLNPQHPLGTSWGTEVQDVAGSWTLGPVWGKLPQTLNLCDLGVLETEGGFLCSAALDEFVILLQRSNPAHLTECRFLWVWLRVQDCPWWTLRVKIIKQTLKSSQGKRNLDEIIWVGTGQGHPCWVWCYFLPAPLVQTP